MKTQISTFIKGIMTISVLLFIIGSSTVNLIASTPESNLRDSIAFTQYKGKVVDSKSKKELTFATLSILGTNIAGVTNSEGEFSIKVPKNNSNAKLMVSYLGYKNKIIMHLY